MWGCRDACRLVDISGQPGLLFVHVLFGADIVVTAQSETEGVKLTERLIHEEKDGRHPLAVRAGNPEDIGGAVVIGASGGDEEEVGQAVGVGEGEF